MPKPREVMGWYEYFISMAKLVAKKSKDPSTQVGNVVVGPDMELRSSGFNGFPRGVHDDLEERWERPDKYDYVSHGEENSVMQAARVGVSLLGCTMFFDCEPYPCARCANAIIQSGIKYVVGVGTPFTGKGGAGADWNKSLAIGREKLIEAGIRIIVLDDDYKIRNLEGDWDVMEAKYLTEMLEPNHFKVWQYRQTVLKRR